MGKGKASPKRKPETPAACQYVTPTGAIIPRNPRWPTLPHLRRGRREDVERRMLSCQPSTKIAEDVAKAWLVSPRIVWRDMRRIRKRWDAEDAVRGGERRLRILKRMELAAVTLYPIEPDTASLVDYRLGRLVGMGGQQKAGTVPVGGVALPVAGGRAALPLESFATDPAALAAVRALRERALGNGKADKPVEVTVTNGHPRSAE